MNLLFVPFLLQMSVSPTYVVHATPLIKECDNLVPKWNTTRGSLVIIDPYTVQLVPDGPGSYEVYANIPDTICGGFIDFEVAAQRKGKK